MNKTLFLTVLASAALAVTSTAAVSITLSGNPTTGPQFVVGASGVSPVLDGSLVRLGTFDAAPAPGATFAALEAAFSEFGRTTIGHSTGSAPVNQGRINRQGITGGAAPTSPADDSTFVGKMVYIWVYNAATVDPLAAQGIFSSTATANTYVDQLAALSIGVNTFANAYGTHPIGNPTNTERNANNQVTFFRLSAPIPEPTTAATFGLLAALGILRRRR